MFHFSGKKDATDSESVGNSRIIYARATLHFMDEAEWNGHGGREGGMLAVALFLFYFRPIVVLWDKEGRTQDETGTS